MRVAMLTGGGDCPGLNAVMRAVVRKGQQVYGDDMIGLRDGWRGAVEDDTLPGVGAPVLDLAARGRCR